MASQLHSRRAVGERQPTASLRQGAGNNGALREGLVKGVLGMDEEIVGAALRGSMHYYALIPIVAIIVSAAFGAVAIAWESDRRATGAMCAIFTCTGLWAFLDMMTFLEADPARAQFWIRWMHMPALFLGPCTTWLLGTMLPQFGNRLAGLARTGFVIAGVLGLAAGMLPGAIVEVVPTPWGSWLGRLGIMSIIIVPVGSVLPMIAAFEASRIKLRHQSEESDRSRARAVPLVVFISLLAAISTEYVMPLMEWPVPRFGAISIACASAIMWLRVLHVSNDLSMTPDGTARSMLDELHDGVALVQGDGTILAVNRRLANMAENPRTELMGTSVEILIQIPLNEIAAGLEHRESELHCSTGGSLPVSLSSSIARNHAGDPFGAVIVFRDLREIHALRRRLLTSGRLAAIGELAAGIAHEVNNPIAFIRSDLNLLAHRLTEIRNHPALAECPPDPETLLESVGDRVDAALEGVERVAEVVGDVRSFAHVGGAGQGGSDPAVLVKGAMRLARLQRGDEVVLRVMDSDCQEWIESGQELKQVLLTLILVLVEGSEKGSSVDAGLDSTGERLQITITAERLVESANAMVRRFDRLSSGEFCASNAEFGLSIATELIEHLGASLSLVEHGPNSLSIILRLSLTIEAD